MNKVLVIDDDLASGILIKDILESDGSNGFPDSLTGLLGSPTNETDKLYGFNVTATTSGKEGVAAVKYATSANDPYMIAFVDLMLDGANGLDVITEIKKIDPNIKLVAFSGNDAPDFSSKPEFGELKKNVFYLQKPFASSEVRQYATVLCEEIKTERELEGLRELVKSQKA